MASASSRLPLTRRSGILLILAFVLCVPEVHAQDFYWALALGGEGHEHVDAAAADETGNVYTVGYFHGTVDFDPGPETFELNSAGGADVVVIKLGLFANLLWARGFGGPGADQGVDVTVDAAGNVFVVGSFYGTVDFDPGPGVFELTSEAQGDPFVVKLDSGGNLIWAISFAGSGYDGAKNVVVDGGGNIVVTGNFSGVTDFDPGPGVFRIESPDGSQMFMVRLDAQGNLLWAQMNEAGGIPPAGGLALGGDGAILATLDGGCFDAYVMRFAASGEFKWVRGTHGEPCNGDQGFGTESREVAVDHAGNSHVFGTFSHIVDFDPGPEEFVLATASIHEIVTFVWKLDPEGNFVWAKHIDTTHSNGYNGVYAGGVDACGRVYTAGTFFSPADFDPGPGTHLISVWDPEQFVWKLDPAGNLLWVDTFEGGGFEQYTNGVVTPTTGNLFLAGQFQGAGDFWPGPGVYSLTSAGGNDQFVQSLTQSPVTLSLLVSPSHLQWDGPACSGGYDIVRGDLGELRSSGGDFESAPSLASRACTPDSSSSTRKSRKPDWACGCWFGRRTVATIRVVQDSTSHETSRSDCPAWTAPDPTVAASIIGALDGGGHCRRGNRPATALARSD